MNIRDVGYATGQILALPVEAGILNLKQCFSRAVISHQYKFTAKYT